MDLQTFVAETLIAIVEGVKQAQERYPAGSGTAAINHLDRIADEAALPDKPTSVSFDIAVTSASETDKGGGRKAGINIKVVEASIYGSNGVKSKNEAISRVAFAVPVNLPVTHSSERHEQSRQRSDAATARLRQAGSTLA